jgi:hypothetical protein
MKTRYILTAIVATAIAACDSMTDIYQEYLDRGETIYIGRVDSLQARPGNGRALLEWEINADPKLVDCIIYLDGRADSLVVPIVRDPGGGKQKMSVVIDDLTERGHLFEVRTRDAAGIVSLKAEKSVICYGDRYAASLVNRAIVALEANPGAAIVTWGITENSVGVEFNYVNRDGIARSLLVPPSETVSVLTDYVSGGSFSYATLYLPVATCIDIFRAAPVSALFPRAESALDNQHEWELVDETSHGDYGDLFGNGWMAFDGNRGSAWHSGWNGETLPQWITLDLKANYTIASVEIYRPGDSWREDTEVVEVWACDNDALDPTDPASFVKVATVNFVGSEESRLVRLAEPTSARYLKFIGTRAKDGKDAIQLSEIYLRVLE